MSNWRTPQEDFWSQDFGAEYIDRNKSDLLASANLAFFGEIFGACSDLPLKVLELGANIGMNVRPIKQLISEADVTCVEINPEACRTLALTGCTVVEGSILDVGLLGEFDLVFTKGVMIHINPNELEKLYETMYQNSKKYILVAEYYNPTPVTIDYRGHHDRLFKRDFAGEILDKFEDVRLVKTGFAYHRGPFPQDDITWFLLEKVN